MRTELRGRLRIAQPKEQRLRALEADLSAERSLVCEFERRRGLCLGPFAVARLRESFPAYLHLFVLPLLSSAAGLERPSFVVIVRASPDHGLQSPEIDMPILRLELPNLLTPGMLAVPKVWLSAVLDRLISSTIDPGVSAVVEM